MISNSRCGRFALKTFATQKLYRIGIPDEDTHTFIAIRAGIFDQYGLVMVISKRMIESRKDKPEEN